jgi:CheY-like chemotaxis protein
VLLVEDDLDIRDTMSELMEAEGYRVMTAGDGAEGIELLRAGNRPRAVLLDKFMPRLDGVAVLAAMAADAALSNIPVVWMSGDQQRPPSVAAILNKPFNAESLMSTLRSVCDGSRPRP